MYQFPNRYTGCSWDSANATRWLMVAAEYRYKGIAPALPHLPIAVAILRLSKYGFKFFFKYEAS